MRAFFLGAPSVVDALPNNDEVCFVHAGAPVQLRFCTRAMTAATVWPVYCCLSLRVVSYFVHRSIVQFL